MEFMNSWLRMDSREFRKYEIFPEVACRHMKYKITMKKYEVSQHKPEGLDLCRIRPT
jgi:hypothetical protein